MSFYNYFWHQGHLYREMEDWERDSYDQSRERQALSDCYKFLNPEFELGDEVFSSHYKLSSAKEDRSCILFSRTLRGFGVLLACEGYCSKLFEEEALVRRCDKDPIVFKRLQTNGWGLTLERKCPLPVEELLCHDHEDFRELGQNIMEDQKLREKIIKMSKKRQIKMFKIKHSDPVLEYAKACPSEEAWYRQGFDQGYTTALRGERKAKIYGENYDFYE